jgi:hypothetical protein
MNFQESQIMTCVVIIIAIALLIKIICPLLLGQNERFDSDLNNVMAENYEYGPSDGIDSDPYGVDDEVDHEVDNDFNNEVGYDYDSEIDGGGDNELDNQDKDGLYAMGYIGVSGETDQDPYNNIGVPENMSPPYDGDNLGVSGETVPDPYNNIGVPEDMSPPYDGDNFGVSGETVPDPYNGAPEKISGIYEGFGPSDVPHMEHFADAKSKNAMNYTIAPSAQAASLSESIGPVISHEKASVMDGAGFQGSKFDSISSKGSQPAGSDTIPENYYFLDDGAKGKMSIQHNMCSKSCCSNQYPLPFKLKYDPAICGSKNKFVPSNIMCNNAYQDSGCLCLEKSQAAHLYNRGGNGRELF